MMRNNLIALLLIMTSCYAYCMQPIPLETVLEEIEQMSTVSTNSRYREPVDATLLVKLRLLKNTSRFRNGLIYGVAYEWFEKKALADDTEKVDIPAYVHETLKSFQLMDETGKIPQEYLDSYKRSLSLTS